MTNCARCKQPIVEGQLYQRAYRAATVDTAAGVSIAVIGETVDVHDRCPVPHPVPRAERQGTICEDYEIDGCRVDGCPAACFHAIRSPQCCAGGPQWGHAFNCPSLP